MCSQLSVKIQTDEIEFRAKVQFSSHRNFAGSLCCCWKETRRSAPHAHDDYLHDHDHQNHDHDHYYYLQLSSREREIDWEIREMQRQQVLFMLA